MKEHRFFLTNGIVQMSENMIPVRRKNTENTKICGSALHFLLFNDVLSSTIKFLKTFLQAVISPSVGAVMDYITEMQGQVIIIVSH